MAITGYKHSANVSPMVLESMKKNMSHNEKEYILTLLLYLLRLDQTLISHGNAKFFLPRWRRSLGVVGNRRDDSFSSSLDAPAL